MSKPAATVLLVDDDEDCHVIYGAALRAAGFRVRDAVNGAECIALARAELPDVIVLDVAMPVVDGRDAVRVLKDDPSTRDIPVIAVTAMGSLHDRGDLERAGFDAVLLKPVDPGIVVTAVQLGVATARRLTTNTETPSPRDP